MKVRTRKKPKRKAPNPLKYDPSRTLTLRRAFAAELHRRFSRLKLEVARLIVDEDAFGLRPPRSLFSANAFCPTGPGGGIDPTCSPQGSRQQTWDSTPGQPEKVRLRFHPEDPARDFEVKRLDGERSLVRDTTTGKIAVVKSSRVETIGGREKVFKERVAKIRKLIDPKLAQGVKEVVGSQGKVEHDLLVFQLVEDAKLFKSEAKKLLKRMTYVGDLVEDQKPHWSGYVVRTYRLPRDEEKLAFNRLTTNDRWRFQSRPEQVKAFRDWLRTQIRGVLGDEQLWQKYVEQGFRKGAGRAFDDTHRSVRARAAGKEQLDFFHGTRDEFLRSSFGRPVAVEKVKLLAGRTFDDLEGVTSEMSTKMVRSLTDGLVQGKNPRDIARDMTKQVDISRARAEVIARDSISRVHAEGQLTALEDLGVEEVGVAVEWSTSGLGVTAKGNPSPCDLCAAMEGVVLKIEEARGLIPRHVGCLCSWVPANVGESAKGQKDTKSSITKAIKSSAKKGTEEEDDWPGLEVSISAGRPESILNVSPELRAFSRFVTNAGDNCGIGPGGFEPGNTCAKGGGGGKRVPGVVKGQKVILEVGPGGEGRVVEGPPELLGKVLKKKAPSPPPAPAPKSAPEPKPAPAEKAPLEAKPAAPKSFASVEAAEDHFYAAHRTNLKKGKAVSDKEFLKLAAHVGGEYERLGAEYKAAATALKARSSRPQSLELGRDFSDDRISSTTAKYTYGQGIEVGPGPFNPGQAPVFGQHGVGGGVGEVSFSFRHEFGHEVYEFGLSGAKRRDWNGSFQKYVGTSTISRYGGTNTSELFAESFSAYTSKSYKRGSLPPDVEGWLDKHVKG